MKAAETRASSAIADWTPLAVAPRSRTTAEMDTFMSDVSTTSTNIAAASRRPSLMSPDDSSGMAAGAVVASAVTRYCPSSGALSHLGGIERGVSVRDFAVDQRRQRSHGRESLGVKGTRFVLVERLRRND